MTVKELHEICTSIVDKGQGNIDVAIDFNSFDESENGSILPIESTLLHSVQGADDSGPVGSKYPFLILLGAQ